MSAKVEQEGCRSWLCIGNSWLGDGQWDNGSIRVTGMNQATQQKSHRGCEAARFNPF